MEVILPAASTDALAGIVADDREGGSVVCERLASSPDVRLEVRRLAVGDYEVQGTWCFERKTVRDFALSLVDGRLFSQAHRLARFPGGRALILEGGEEDIGGVTREAWQGALLCLGLAFQLPVLRSRDGSESAQLLVYAARQAVRQRETLFVPVPRRARTIERQRIQVLAALPGVGRHRAQLLLEHFGSIEAVVLAGEDELTAVRGIGPHTAGVIRRVVGAGAQEGRFIRPEH